MTESCHNSVSGINFLSDLAPKEISWDDHRSNAQSVQTFTNIPKNLTNSAERTMAVQASAKYNKLICNSLQYGSVLRSANGVGLVMDRCSET